MLGRSGTVTGADGEAFPGSTAGHRRLRTVKWPILRRRWNEAALGRGTSIFEQILMVEGVLVSEVTDPPYSAIIFSYFKIKGSGSGPKKEKAGNRGESVPEPSLSSLPPPQLRGGCLVKC